MATLEMIRSGGFTMVPLVVCSLAVWVITFERLWRFYRLGRDLESFHLQAVNALLSGEQGRLRGLCEANPTLPSAKVIAAALDRLGAKDERLRQGWREALERRRLRVNHDLRRNLWILGTIGSASPFVGLAGTVVGILQSFQEMARTGSGGFAVVATGISQALIATAAGIIVAVVAVVAYNAFQTRWNSLTLAIRAQTDEIAEMLGPNGP